METPQTNVHKNRKRISRHWIQIYFLNYFIAFCYVFFDPIIIESIKRKPGHSSLMVFFHFLGVFIPMMLLPWLIAGFNRLITKKQSSSLLFYIYYFIFFGWAGFLIWKSITMYIHFNMSPIGMFNDSLRMEFLYVAFGAFILTLIIYFSNKLSSRH